MNNEELLKFIQIKFSKLFGFISCIFMMISVVSCFVSAYLGISYPVIINVLLIFYFSSLIFNINNNVEIIREKSLIFITDIPNYVTNTDTYTFIVNEKEFSTIKTKDTKYIKDSCDNPYIIVDKITYNIMPCWFIDKNYEISQKYILLEVHF